jgi:hypothetical protein
MTTEPIQRDVANHVLWAYTEWWGDPREGYSGGDFVDKLVLLIKEAAPASRQRLRLGYGQYVAAVELIGKDGGLDVLRSAANPTTSLHAVSDSALKLAPGLPYTPREPIIRALPGGAG